MVWLVGLARVALVLIPLLVILPGCLSAAPQACQGEACDVPPTTPRFITRPPGVDFPPLPEEEALRSFRLEDCTGLSSGSDVPYDRVRQAVPNDFQLVEWTPGTARVAIFPHTCERAVLGEQIFASYQELYVAALVRTVNPNWEPSGVSFYTFAHLAHPPEAVAILRSWGLPTANASFQIGPATVPGSEGHAWDVRGSDLILSLSYLMHEPTFVNRTATNYFWTGDGPFLRSTQWITYRFDSLVQRGLAESAGGGQAASVLGGPIVVWGGSPLRAFSSAGLVDVEVFGV